MADGSTELGREERPLDRFRPWFARFGTAGLVLTAFCALDVCLRLTTPPRPSEELAADPFLATLQASITGWGVVILCAVVGVGVLWWQRPSKAALRKELALAAAGVIGAVALVVLVRVIWGDKLPSFIPPEESAAPGRVLGLEAGIAEEAFFRFAVLPALYWCALRGFRQRRVLAAVLACAITAVLFALAHELPPSQGGFDPRLFATRTLIPGAGMSLLALWPGPAFIVGAHCGAHVVIPMMFR